jgi:hypothetical protein
LFWLSIKEKEEEEGYLGAGGNWFKRKPVAENLVSDSL